MESLNVIELYNKERNGRNTISKKKEVGSAHSDATTIAEQTQSMDAEKEDHWEDVIFGFHPQPVSVSRQLHASGAKQLFCQLKGLVVLQQGRKRLNGESIAAALL